MPCPFPDGRPPEGSFHPLTGFRHTPINHIHAIYFLSSTTYFLNDQKVGNPGRPGRRIKLA